MNDPIYFGEEHRLFRDNLRRFVENEIVPQALAWEDAGMVPRAVLRRMGELGYLGIRYGHAFGGSELDTVYSAILAEELGRSTFGGFAVTVTVHTDMASPHLANFGNPEQLARYLPPIIRGESICAVAVTEPDAGSDVAGIRTRAVRDGDSWVINGSKMFITNGVHADVVFVAAKTQLADAAPKGSRAISMFIVDQGTPGFRIGRTLDKSGWRCSDTAELILDDCRVPSTNLLGSENKGFYPIMRTVQTERSAPPCGTSRRSASAWRCARRKSRRRAASCITRPGSTRSSATASRKCRW
jgi:acyl-CoA dehydrogenase